MELPKEPAMLLSVVNTRLRDFYPSLEKLCQAMGADRAGIERELGALGYFYRPEQNQFRPEEKT